MDREILSKLFLKNKKDQENKEKLMDLIEKLHEELIKSGQDNVSDFLYNTLCDYFMVGENNITLRDIISEATTSSKRFKTLKELEDEVNKIRQGE